MLRKAVLSNCLEWHLEWLLENSDGMARNRIIKVPKRKAHKGK